MAKRAVVRKTVKKPAEKNSGYMFHLAQAHHALDEAAWRVPGGTRSLDVEAAMLSIGRALAYQIVRNHE